MHAEALDESMCAPSPNWCNGLLPGTVLADGGGNMRVRKTGMSLGSVVASVLLLTGLSTPARGAVGAGTKPTVAALEPSVTSLPHVGGDVLLSTTVTMGDGSVMPDGTCQFTASRAIPGLPATVSCIAGAVSYGVTIPANLSTKAYSVKFRLAVTGTPGGKPVKSPWSALVVVDPYLGIASAISAGSNHTCAITGSTGLVRCWGGNTFGQLGTASTVGYPLPYAVTGVSGAVGISAGKDHTCVLVSGGKIKCWGHNDHGQLGNGTYANSSVPVTVNGLSGATAVSAGNDHSCAVLSDGTVQCWGGGYVGQLGNGATADSSVPVAVNGLFGATGISAGGYHTCARMSASNVECWGAGVFGQLGNGHNNSSNVPVAVTGISGATGISAGEYHTCALVSDGEVKCWGYGGGGRLGNFSAFDANAPVSVLSFVTGSPLSGVTAVSAGGQHTCALISGGLVQCWGFNGDGQLGDGTIVAKSYPVGASGLSGATGISAGNGHSCALLTGGTVRCWGFNGDGQLGNGGYTNPLWPGPVSGL